MARLLILLLALTLGFGPAAARAMPAMACCPPAVAAHHGGGHHQERGPGSMADCACPAAAPAVPAAMVVPAAPVQAVPLATVHPLPAGCHLAFEPPPPRTRT